MKDDSGPGDTNHGEGASGKIHGSWSQSTYAVYRPSQCSPSASAVQVSMVSRAGVISLKDMVVPRVIEMEPRMCRVREINQNILPVTQLRQPEWLLIRHTKRDSKAHAEPTILDPKRKPSCSFLMRVDC